MTTQPASDGLTQLAGYAAGLGLLVGLIAAWLYMAGWAYAYHYFGHYRLGLAPLAIPREYIALYGLWVAQAHPLQLGLAVLLLVLVAGAPPALQEQPVVRWLLRTATVALVVLLCFLGYSLAVELAERQHAEDAADDFPGHPRLQVWVVDAWAADSALGPLAKELAEGCHRLLFQNTTALFLFRPRRDAALVDLPVLTVPFAQLRATRLLPDRRSCP